MKEIRRYISYGRVQGVGYRQFVIETARRLNISGTVRNLDDGTVETFAKQPPKQSPEESSQESAQLWHEFESYLRKGPLFAKVTDLTYTTYDSPEKVPLSVKVDWNTFALRR